MTSRAPRVVRPHNYLAYGLTDVLGAGAMAVLSGWVVFFYTTYCGLSIIEAGSVFTISRLLDAFWSPLVGHISDKFGKTPFGRRFGRRRGILLLSIPLLPCFALMWVQGQTYWYYLATFVFFELLYATVLIPYETLAAEMTDDYKKKAKFAGVRILVGQSSAILASILPKLIIDTVGGKDSPDTFLTMGVIFGVLFSVVVFITWMFTWERDPSELPDEPDGPKQSLLGILGSLYANLGSTLRIRAFRQHLGIYLGGYLSQDVFNLAATFFIVYALMGSVGAVDVASAALSLMFFAQLFSVAVFIWLIMRIGPGPSYLIAAGLFAAGIGALYVLGFMPFDKATTAFGVPLGAPLAIVAAISLAGLGRGGLNYIPWSAYNYMADVDQIVTGLRREGAFAGVMTFVRKTAQAIAIQVGTVLLAWGGFEKGAETQSASALGMLSLLLTVGPLALLAMGLFFAATFKLNARTHGVLMTEIARLKAGERTPSSPEAQRIVEDLSGWKWDQLWGRNTVGRRRTDAAPAP